MKYFTPELILRGGSLNDAEADKAEEEWERAVEAYERELAAIRGQLPADVVRFLDDYNLHDSRVLLFALSEDDQAAEWYVQPATEGAPLLSLTYALTEAPRVIPHSEIAEPGAPLDWLYDEVGLLSEGAATVFTHDILFTSGDEVRLTFREFRLARKHTLPALRLLSQANETGVGRSAAEV